ncbi:MAG: hypothetical protein E7Z63_00970 [Thermoplasmata archaeon]|nr:hypothetical protein [Thermoplasmata archaeon]
MSDRDYEVSPLGIYIERYWADNNIAFGSNRYYRVPTYFKLSYGVQEIIHETEKAILAKVVFYRTERDIGIYGEGENFMHVEKWIPKSRLIYASSPEEAKDISLGRSRLAISRYEALVKWARAHGVKVREGWQYSTIELRILNKGLYIPDDDELQQFIDND